jgi:hypothetical protein
LTPVQGEESASCSAFRSFLCSNLILGTRYLAILPPHLRRPGKDGLAAVGYLPSFSPSRWFQGREEDRSDKEKAQRDANARHFAYAASTKVSGLSPAISSKSYPLHPSFTEFSTRFSPLYLISLQQRSLNLVLYTLNPILETYFVPNFCAYVFIIPQTLWTYFIFI